MRDSWFIKTRGDQYDHRSAPVRNTHQSIKARTARPVPRGQEYPDFPAPFCPDALSTACLVHPSPCSHWCRGEYNQLRFLHQRD